MQLTLAGPGAGKTTDMIEQIIEKLPCLQPNRDMAVITYTNESVKDIKKKINQSICIPRNVFIGTIHSFLVHYFIIPYAFTLGYKSNPIMIVDKFDTTGMGWIDQWAEKKFSDIRIRESRKIGLIQRHYKISRENAARNGIYTYDSIIKISKELAEKNDISKLVSNKLQFLFIDEYQDISKYAHDIVMQLEKKHLTYIAVVGDPDQSIYRFRYGSSQIGERAPAENKQPIILLQSLPPKECSIRKLLINHRSSQEIVEFNNKYGTLDNQVPEKESVCKICFMQQKKASMMLDQLMKLGEKYCCKSYLVLGKKQKTADYYKPNNRSFGAENRYISLKSITDFIIAKSGMSHRDFLTKYDIDKCILNHIAAEVRKRYDIQQLEEELLLEKIRNVAMESYGISLVFKDALGIDDSKKVVSFGFSKNWDAEDESGTTNEIRFLTIHKSKGLEADCVLVVAETENEFFKWINMTPRNMKSLSDEDYRLAYVAFTRARRVLILTCLQDIDTSKLEVGTFSII